MAVDRTMLKIWLDRVGMSALADEVDRMGVEAVVELEKLCGYARPKLRASR